MLSSFSGEFGVWYRSAYCASKFAVNGFFESLRMELNEKMDFTVVCPITVQTDFRNYSLIKTPTKATESEKGGSLTAKVAVDQIMSAADYRVHKFLFPFSPWMAMYTRSIFPGYITNKVK